jgi:hypothetical protein
MLRGFWVTITGDRITPARNCVNVFACLRTVHSVETGAKRYVDAFLMRHFPEEWPFTVLYGFFSSSALLKRQILANKNCFLCPTFPPLQIYIYIYIYISLSLTPSIHLSLKRMTLARAPDFSDSGNNSLKFKMWVARVKLFAECDEQD